MVECSIYLAADNMNQFTIRDIENLSGIKAHTLRVWELRYSLLTPKRKESNHRVYDNEDLKHILRISYLYHSGVKISHIAKLESSSIEKILTGVKTGSSNEYLISQLIEAAIDFDDERFANILNGAFKGPVEAAMLNIIYPFLKRIGLLWITEHIIPAQEHFSSSIITRKLILALETIGQIPVTTKRTILLYAPQHEHHELPLLFIHYLLKKNGNKVIYFGGNVYVKDIAVYCRQHKVTHLHFHLVTNLLDAGLDEYILDLSKRFPENQIIMSGPAVESVKVHPVNVRLLYSLQELMQFVQE